MAGVKGRSGGARPSSGPKPGPKKIFEREFVGPRLPKRTRRTFATEEEREAAMRVREREKYRKVAERKKAEREEAARAACAAQGVEYLKYASRVRHEFCCAACGTPFVAKARNAKYCSPACRARVSNTCPDKSRRLKVKYQTDPLFNLKVRMRKAIRHALHGRGFSKAKRTREVLGCDWQTFASHIERQFLPGMSWDNRDRWHLDHIVPLATAATEAEVLALNHFTNLRPLWAQDNIAKGAEVRYLL